jgi:hypothetical protein
LRIYYEHEEVFVSKHLLPVAAATTEATTVRIAMMMRESNVVVDVDEKEDGRSSLSIRY